MALTLRNAGSRRVRGVTLLITAQEFAPGGKGSVARPCIDVAPGQEFTVPVDIRLVRPVQQAGGPLVRVQLDGVLFDDLSFFGPNKLNSQRAMTFWETEAQRDRAYFKQVLQARGEKALRERNAAEHGEAGGAPATGCCAEPQRARGRIGGSVGRPRGAVCVSEDAGAPVQPVEGWAEICRQ